MVISESYFPQKSRGTSGATGIKRPETSSELTGNLASESEMLSGTSSCVQIKPGGFSVTKSIFYDVDTGFAQVQWDWDTLKWDWS